MGRAVGVTAVITFLSEGNIEPLAYLSGDEFDPIKICFFKY